MPKFEAPSRTANHKPPNDLLRVLVDGVKEFDHGNARGVTLCCGFDARLKKSFQLLQGLAFFWRRSLWQHSL